MERYFILTTRKAYILSLTLTIMPLQIFKAECSKCDKVIEGLSESAVKFNMDIHVKAKHKKEQKK